MKYIFVTGGVVSSLGKGLASASIGTLLATLNWVVGWCVFGVNIIPHTQQVTTWGLAKAGDPVNLEIDMLARYVARLVQKD